MLKPQVAAFLDIVSRHGGPDLRFEEIEITPACPQAGRTIRETRVRHETGALIVALKKADGSFDTTPDPDAELNVGDVLIAVGTEEELKALEELFAPLPPGRRRSRSSRLEAGALRARRHGGRARAPVRPRARRLRDERGAEGRARAGRRRASSPRSSPAAAAGLPEVERAEVAGPGLRQPLADRGLVPRRSGRGRRRR